MIDCAKAKENLKTTPNSQGLLNALAIDDPIEYARLVLNDVMADWVWSVNNLNFISLYQTRCFLNIP